MTESKEEFPAPIRASTRRLWVRRAVDELEEACERGASDAEIADLARAAHALSKGILGIVLS